MKENNKIYEALRNRKDNLCHKSEIVSIIQEYKKKFRSKIDSINVVKYLSRHNYIKRVFQGYYYLNSIDERKRRFCSYEDKELLFMTLNKLNIKWYIGLNSALYLQGKIWQVPNTLTIINQRFSGRKIVLGLKVRFVKIKESLIFGIKEGKTKNNVPYSYSTLAKTYLDLSYFRESEKLVILKDTQKYLKKYPLWLHKLT